MNEITISGYKIKYNRISNSKLLKIKTELIKPEVPKSYIEAQDRWVENPFDPDYPIALSVYMFEQSEARLNYILDSVDVEYNIDISKIITKKHLKLFELTEINLNLEYLFKKYFLFSTQELRDILINNICLTENRVFTHFEEFNVERNNVPIMEHGLHNAINTNLNVSPLLAGNNQLVHPIDEYKIVKESNVDWIRWLNNEYDLEDMAQTIALYRMNKIIDSHNEDEIAIEQEKRNKKGK